MGALYGFHPVVNLHSNFAIGSVKALVILDINKRFQDQCLSYLLRLPQANHSGLRGYYSHTLIKGYLNSDFEDNTDKMKLSCNIILATAL